MKRGEQRQRPDNTICVSVYVDASYFALLAILIDCLVANHHPIVMSSAVVSMNS